MLPLTPSVILRMRTPPIRIKRQFPQTIIQTITQTRPQTMRLIAICQRLSG